MLTIMFAVFLLSLYAFVWVLAALLCKLTQKAEQTQLTLILDHDCNQTRQRVYSDAISCARVYFRHGSALI